jgi:uncharacterized membrane protein YfcA
MWHSAIDLLVVLVAAFLSGAVNAVSGGGSLIAFPAMLATGQGVVAANVGTTVGLVPGYLGGSVAYRRELRGQGRRFRVLAVTGVIGGAGGAVLLLISSEHTFDLVVPWLVFLSAGLLAAQPALARFVQKRLAQGGRSHGLAMHASVLACALYGAYFGAGLGVMLLAALGSFVQDTLQRLNALKGLLSFVINAVATVLFAFLASVPWAATGVLAVGALAGGHFGVGLARRLGDRTLRWVTVVFGVVVGIVLLIKL